MTPESATPNDDNDDILTNLSTAPTPDAPHGYFPDGRPRKRAPRGSRASGEGQRGQRKTRSPAPDFRPTIHQLTALISTLIAFVGKRSNSAPLVADALILDDAGPHIADAANTLILNYPTLVARLQLATKVTPVTEFASALAPVVLAIMSAHGLINGPSANEIIKSASTRQTAQS